ncbi:hypothetical protein [Pseudomonas caspiana]|uniref:Molecular chaperone n=1 Tax=Pseudomonas caspiana TaxID=1451454 RepID=A0A1Y3NWC4_9PSED|nr:hypothetical protein [Pseudomonas caspiana]OUM71889.1 hypothetical protein AUC60_21440 [Pseudomonas caspiana]
MNFKFAVCLALNLVCLSALADTLTVKMDKNYYFQKFDQKEIEISVSNPSSKLVFAEAALYKGNLKDGQVDFDFGNKITNYDVYPTSIVIPAGQNKKIKLFRDTAAVRTGQEEYYRIRVTPKSADAALKANPKLMELLTASEKQSIADEGSVTAKLNFFLGSGSVLIVQEGASVLDKNISISKLVKNATVEFFVSNNGVETVELEDAKVFVGKKFIQLGSILLRAGGSRTIAISSEDLKGNSMTADSDFNEVRFADQHKQDHVIALGK